MSPIRKHENDPQPEISREEWILIREDIDSLTKRIFKGNGEPSLVTQVTRIETQMQAIDEKIEQKFQSFDTQMGLKFENITAIVGEKFNSISNTLVTELQNQKSKTHNKVLFRSAWVPAVIASITSIIVIFIAHLIK